MNTPAHVVLNLLVLSPRDRPQLFAPVTLGAVLPDAPMFGFYLHQRLVAGRPEAWIWSRGYFDPDWQLFFDLFNSIPLILLGLLVARRTGAVRGMALFASMGLHALFDLLLHNDDAHRHFLPFSGWRFESPVSYWDPRHYGELASVAEIGLVLVGCLVLSRRFRTRTARVLVGSVLGVYTLYIGYAVVVWVLPSR